MSMKISRFGLATALASIFGASGCRSAAAPDVAAAPPSSTPSAADALASNTHAKVGANPGGAGRGTALTPAPGHELAAFAEGCFWGSENTFRHVRGVVATAVGYTGGRTQSPTYETVCSHTTGHAETVLVEFDPAVVSYDKLLDVFFQSHDPTTKDRQGPDVGDQYRSAIFTLSPAQDTAAHAAIQRYQTRLDRPITTIVGPLGAFWKAEDYHQQYDEKNGGESCAMPALKTY